MPCVNDACCAAFPPSPSPSVFKCRSPIVQVSIQVPAKLPLAVKIPIRVSPVVASTSTATTQVEVPVLSAPIQVKVLVLPARVATRVASAWVSVQAEAAELRNKWRSAAHARTLITSPNPHLRDWHKTARTETEFAVWQTEMRK